LTDEDSLKNPDKYYVNKRELTKRNKQKRHFSKTDNFFFNLLASNKLLPIQNFFKNTECSIKNSMNENQIIGRRSNIKLNMDTSESFEFYCAAIHCTIGNIRKDQSALIRLRFRLWSKSLAAVTFYFKLF
jgi:hypothetical protein